METKRMIAMTYDEALNYIHTRPKRGRAPTIEPMRRLMERLGNPQNRLKFIHIGGTNGKGSTTAMCAAILSEAGYRCGMYTSPFVIDYRERIQMDGRMIPEEDLVRCAEQVKEQANLLEQEGLFPVEFEIGTAIAFLWFAERCEIVCLEVGLGGRYDATNVIQTPLASVLTSISLDHTQFLGDTVEQIAGEKAGIIKKNGTCICYPKQDSDAVAVLLEESAGKGACFIQANPNAVEILSSDVFGSTFRYNQEEYRIRLAGEHQVFNAVNVLETMACIGEKGFPVSRGQLKAGLARAVMPARFELLQEHPAVVLDGAHNPEGMSAIALTLSRITASKKILIVGMMADKDYEHALRTVCAQADEVVCVPVSCPRALSCQELLQCVSGFHHHAIMESDLEKAYLDALKRLDRDGLLLICGSFFLAGDMRKIIK